MGRLIALILLLNTISSFGYSTETDTLNEVNSRRLKLVVGAGSLAYTGTMVGLGTIWYEDFSKFHFFNDNDGWGYMDKIGHLTTAQHAGRYGINTLRWAGVPENKAIWMGGSVGLVFLTSVEMFDGFSEDWGFSPGDVLANTIGAGMAIGQEVLWKDQPILSKWSYSKSPYARYRPELLGSNASERWLKDYNGQTYWLSVNVNKLILKNQSVPKWLNIAVGYSIEGYTGANRNPTVNSAGELIPEFRRYGQFYISPDIDWSKINTNSAFLNTILDGLNFLKMPLPGVEYNVVDGWRFHLIIF
jgi:hypothetical protein